MTPPATNPVGGGPEPTDEELVARVQASPEGDLQAFELLLERHQERVLANCRYLTRSAPDSEDLAQEVFVKAYFNLQRFEGRSQFKTWLQRIKVNHCLSFLDKRSRRKTVNVEDEEQRGTAQLKVASRAHRNLESVRARHRISEVLDELNDTLRVPLILRDADGLSYQEIADSLGIGLSAVKMRIKRAREEFRRLYGEPI